MSGTTKNLAEVCFATSLRGWAVGNQGTILVTSDGGVHWKKQASKTTAELNSVSFANSSRGCAVGQWGTILRTSDSGARWKMLSSTWNGGFADVSFSDATHGWTVGEEGTHRSHDRRRQDVGAADLGHDGRPVPCVLSRCPPWLGTRLPVDGLQDLRDHRRRRKLGPADQHDGHAVRHLRSRCLALLGASATVASSSRPATVVRPGDPRRRIRRKASTVSRSRTPLTAGRSGHTVSALTPPRSSPRATAVRPGHPQTSGTTDYLNDVDFPDATHGWVVGEQR